MTRRPVATLWALPLLLGVPATSGRAQSPSFEDVVGLPQAGWVAISPDGRSVAYTIRTTDWAENRFGTEIWLARAGATPLQLTRTPKGSSSTPRWSPDGAWIGFLSNRGEQQQVYVIAAGGGEALKATAAPQGVSAFRWSPDGKRIAYTAVDPESAESKQRREKYGGFAIEDEPAPMTHLWVVAARPERSPADSTGATRLTEGAGFTVGGFEWSPDGSAIAFDHRAGTLVTAAATQDISVLTVADRVVRPLVSAPGPDGSPVWSPDGRWIAYTSSGGDTTSNYYRNNRLWKIPAGGGTPTRLAADFDEQIGGVSWTPRGIFFPGFAGARRQLFRVDPDRGTTRLAVDSPLTIGAVTWSTDGSRAGFLAQSASTLLEVYLASLDRFAPERVTALTDRIVDWPIGSADVIKWTSQDGTGIEGVLHKPRDFDPAKRYPLFVVIHGGPTGIDLPQPLPGGVYPIAQWVARGALVLRPNYRGSAGYGEAFRSLNVRNLGVGDMWDVMSGVDHLVRLGIVDTARVGAMGWSQGGYISAFLTTNTDRFRAISVGAGISNWVTYYVSTDIYPFTRQYLEATPWEDPEVYARTSPMTAIRQARTPTLIQHGEFDRRVPIQNAYELHQGLLDHGVPTQLIVYKGFGHGINRPKEQLAALQHNWDWFERYLWDGAARTNGGREGRE